MGRGRTFEYRADIDGLRAVAALMVTVYHTLPCVCGGGFVGVDVFFVISGFLITTLLARDLATDTFSMRTFLTRRARRILPPLLPVLAAVGIFGALSLAPTDFEKLAREVLAGLGFYSNFHYRAQTDHFVSDLNLKPLFHLWSLAVEEQFYLVWPALLWILHRRRSDPRLGVAVLVVLSFAHCVMKTMETSFAAYVEPLPRFWELGAGALLALSGPVPERWVNAAGGGLALVLASAVWFGEGLAFPGAWAIIPVLGTVLVIGAGPCSWLARHVLARPTLVAIGRSSYALYLWHWPVLAFDRALHVARSPPLGRVALVLGACALAWASTRFVEAPLRFSKRWRTRTLVGYGVVAIFALLAACDDGVRWHWAEGLRDHAKAWVR